MTAETVVDPWWLYAVTRNAPDPEHAVPGVAGERVRVIREAGLTALAGPVPRGEFGQPAVRRNLENLDWLSAVARAHDAVIRSAMSGGATVPVRLVTLFSDEATVRALLCKRGPDFEAALRRLTGRTEWGVKVFGGAPPEPSDASPSDTPPSPEPEDSKPGTSYLLRRRAALSERERVVHAATEYGERLHARLAAFSVAGRRHPVARDRAGTLLLNSAYLVEDGRFEEFRDVVQADPGDSGVRVELTGPWPPYSFASVPGVSDDDD